MPDEENAFTAKPKINSHSQIFRHGRRIFCLPHQPKFSDLFDYAYIGCPQFVISSHQILSLEHRNNKFKIRCQKIICFVITYLNQKWKKKKLTNENIILMFWVKFPIKTIPIQSCHKLQINRKYCLHPLTTEPRRLLTTHVQKFKGFLQIASIHHYDTMNTMKYSRICENIDFFLILSL